MPAKDVHVGAQGARALSALNPNAAAGKFAFVFEASEVSNLIDREKNGEGVLYASAIKHLWCVIRTSPQVENARGQIMEKATRLDFRFKDGFYFNAKSNKHFAEIEEYIKAMADYGYNVRPMEEITRANKARELAEAIKIMNQVTPGEETKSILRALAPQVRQMTEAEKQEMRDELHLNPANPVKR